MVNKVQYTITLELSYGHHSEAIIYVRNRWLYDVNTLFHINLVQAMKGNSTANIWNITGVLKLNRW